MWTHLRRNVVAYLALIVALSTGTAYAAGLANGSVTTKKLAPNSVTSPKIKNGGVTGSDVKDGALTGADVAAGSLGANKLAAGVLPADWTLATQPMTTDDPVATPDTILALTQNFTAAAAGTAYLRVDYNRTFLNCSAGGGFMGLYLDGVPVPDTKLVMTNSADPRSIMVMGTASVTAGPHVVQVGLDCPSGSLNAQSVLNPVVLVLVQPS
jgi:hypothetical protein